MSGPIAAYGILSHGEPGPIERLVLRIRALSPSSLVLVHHDKRWPQPFTAGPTSDERRDPRPPGVEVLDSPDACVWGDWTMVAAQQRLLARILAHPEVSWCVLLSGTDWPLVPLARWEAALVGAGVDVVHRSRPLVEPPRPFRRPSMEAQEWMRYHYRWRPLPHLTRLADDVRPLQEGLTLLRRLGLFLPLGITLHEQRRARGWYLGYGPVARTFFTDRPVRKGHPWCGLSRRAAALLLERSCAEIGHFLSTSLHPDEAWIGSILESATELRRLPIPLTYTPWERVHERGEIEVWPDDLAAAAASGAAFARKVSGSRAEETRQALDRLVEERDRATPSSWLPLPPETTEEIHRDDGVTRSGRPAERARRHDPTTSAAPG